MKRKLKRVNQKARPLRLTSGLKSAVRKKKTLFGEVAVGDRVWVPEHELFAVVMEKLPDEFLRLDIGSGEKNMPASQVSLALTETGDSSDMAPGGVITLIIGVPLSFLLLFQGPEMTLAAVPIFLATIVFAMVFFASGSGGGSGGSSDGGGSGGCGGCGGGGCGGGG